MQLILHKNVYETKNQSQKKKTNSHKSVFFYIKYLVKIYSVKAAPEATISLSNL